MALIKSQLVLTDGMTGPLKGINKAMNIVLNSFEAMQDASGRAIDTASIQEGPRKASRASARWTSWKTIRINRLTPSAVSRKLSGL